MYGYNDMEGYGRERWHGCSSHLEDVLCQSLHQSIFDLQRCMENSGQKAFTVVMVDSGDTNVA